jgi:hypothetical protein
VSKFAEQPVNISTLSNGVSFYTINTSDFTNVTWVLIKLYYTDAEITGIDESTLQMSWYNETSGDWIILSAGNPDWVYDTGVNAAENYVWANMTHFSMYGINGSSIVPPPAVQNNNPGSTGAGGLPSKSTTTTISSTTQTTTTSQTPTATSTITSSTSTLPSEKLPTPFGITYSFAIIIIAVILVAIFIIFSRRK